MVTHTSTDSAYIDARATHLLFVTLGAVTTTLVLLRDKPWNPGFFAAFGALAVIGSALFWKRQPFPLYILILTAFLGSWSLVAGGYAEFRYLIWTVFGIASWWCGWEALRGCPAITEAYGYAAIAFGVSVGLGITLCTLAHWPVSLVFPACMLTSCAAFAWGTSSL